MLTLAEKFILETCIELMDWVTKPSNVKDMPFDTHRGICPNLNLKIKTLTLKDVDYFFNLDSLVVMRTIQDICKDWPKYSRNSSFPIPVPDDLIEEYGYSSNATSDIYYTEGDKYTGSYGELRLELLQFIIDTLKKD